MRRIVILLTILLAAAALALTATAAEKSETPAQETAVSQTAVFLPLILKPQPDPMVEFRGLWVSRFDWTEPGKPASPARLDQIVNNAAAAGFNVIFFQVRGAADAYYTPGLEPWAARVSGGALGQPPSPAWDPLAHIITKAHAKGIQVHAYINVYPVWDKCSSPPGSQVTPTPLYHLLAAAHGTTNGKLNSVLWDKEGNVYCEIYLRGTPASDYLNDHLIAVAADLVTRYDIDGLHLDNVRYGGDITSCDPVSLAAFGGGCFAPGYGDWQRQQVNNTVRRFYEEVVPLKPGLWLSAAVWPIHRLDPAWNFPGFPQQGYVHYYQDSKAWLAGAYIDSISPMIYPGGETTCPDSSYWTPQRWQTLTADFQAARNGRYIIPGIGADYCTFDEIAARIQMARQIGTAGHALFAYTGLEKHSYFDDLANGPYAIPAVVPANNQ